MAEPMAHLERVMGYIRSGILCHDSTRSGRWYLDWAQDGWDSEGRETTARQSASEQPSAVEPQVGAWCPDSDTPGDIEHQSAGESVGGVALEPPADGAGAGIVPRLAATTGRAGRVNCVRLQAVSYALIWYRTCPA